MTDFTIARLGLKGDGIADDNAHLPLTLPGERVRATETDGGWRLEAVLAPSPQRVAPGCPHFGACGGCALQHAADGFVAAWKGEVIARALAARGLAAEVRPTLTSPAHSRRRATFAARRTKKTVAIGFHARAGHDLVPIATCDVVTPALMAVLPALAAIVRAGLSRSGEATLTVTETEAGPDVAAEGLKPLDAALRATLAGLAEAHGLARLSAAGETVAQLRPPLVRFGGHGVALPPGAFLQATAEGEAALRTGVAEAAGPASRIVDLFAGCGTFALPLAERAEVLAVEGDAAMLAALDAGWRQAAGLKRLRTEARDLFRRPLLPPELDGFDAAVIDPPRAGAEAQSRQIAASRLPVVAMVSCNPVSFARDAAILVAAGFGIDWIQPVDQFRWSPHVELVARLSR